MFSFPMDVKSVITSPSPGLELAGPGVYQVSGMAWSGLGRIARVEVSADGGESWAEAALSEPVLDKAVTRFRMAWRWNGAPAVIMSRAVDETGAVQPTRDAIISAKGMNFAYHYNGIQAWRGGLRWTGVKRSCVARKLADVGTNLPIADDDTWLGGG